MKLEHIELERLSISSLNMRAKRSPDLASILPSVRERGILVPLLVRAAGEGDRFEIVAGRRRYLAASAVAEERGQSFPVPCAIMEAGDDAAALEASLIENFARLAPDEVTQWETFARLIKEGRSAEDIAATFGITERLVKRILALGNLLPRIRNLYRQELIDAATIRHLTMATKAQQKEWLKLYDSPDAYAPTGQTLKTWLCGGELIATKAALFDPALYQGSIVQDLFGEDCYFADPDAFWTLQHEAVAAKRQAYLDDGWSAVELIEPGSCFQNWEYEKRSKSRKGRVYIVLFQRGEVEVHEGLLPRREANRQERNDNDVRPERPELTTPLRNYVDLHRHAAVRASLVATPEVAFRLMLAHAIAGSALWSVRPDPQAAIGNAVAESVETSRGETLFDQKRRAVLALLEMDAEAPTVVGEGRRRETMALFRRLLELGAEEVEDIASVVMGETLAAGSTVVDELGVYLDLDMASLWHPDGALFDHLRDKQVITALLAEVAGLETARANAGETGKVMKSIIRDCLAGANGRMKVERWVPRWLRFPASTYKAQPAAAADAVVEVEPPATTLASEGNDDGEAEVEEAEAAAQAAE